MARTRTRPRFRAQPKISPAVQDGHIRSRFPSFTKGRLGTSWIWTGWLQPSEFSPRFQVRITLPPYSSPTVEVMSPQLAPNAPHLYRNGELCLYFPDDWTWTGHDLLVETILPWTASWLFYYDLWTQTGEWLGPEAPHTKGK